jgi:A/G-specific adenine glycosylase
LKNKSGRATIPVPALLRWFERNRRDLPWRRAHDIYSVWVSEVMLQQTQVNTVLPYYRGFLKRFPTLRRLAAASLQDVLKAWEGLGYYSRARNLWLAARRVREEFHGRIPVTYDGFRSLAGVGDYIAAAVLSIGRGLPLPVVDGNVLRVVCRWQGIQGDILRAATKKQVHSSLSAIIPDIAPGRFNEALMELGALVCTPKNPLCPKCPLRLGCFAFSNVCTGDLPLKGKKKAVPTYRVALAVIRRDRKFFIQQRPEKGHLGGLWEFPGGKCLAGEAPEQTVVRECREELRVGVKVLSKLAVVPHAYTHFRIVLHVFICKLCSGVPRTPQSHAWIESGELGKYPFPAANHKLFPTLKAYMNKD